MVLRLRPSGMATVRIVSDQRVALVVEPLRTRKRFAPAEAPLMRSPRLRCAARRRLGPKASAELGSEIADRDDPLGNDIIGHLCWHADVD